jgi:hypothetical protein
MRRPKRRCIFRCTTVAYMIIMQSKNKARDHAFNSKGGLCLEWLSYGLRGLCFLLFDVSSTQMQLWYWCLTHEEAIIQTWEGKKIWTIACVVLRKGNKEVRPLSPRTWCSCFRSPGVSLSTNANAVKTPDLLKKILLRRRRSLVGETLCTQLNILLAMSVGKKPQEKKTKKD